MKQVIAFLLIASGLVALGARASAQQPAVPRPTPLAPPAVTLQPPPAPGMGTPSGTYREPSARSGSLNYTIPSRPPKKRMKKPRRYRGSTLLVHQV